MTVSSRHRQAMQKIAGLAAHLLGAAIGGHAGSQHSNWLSPGFATWHASHALQPHRGRRQAALQLRSQIVRAQQLRLPACRHLRRSRQSSLLVAAAKHGVHPFQDSLPPRLWGGHCRGLLSTATWLAGAKVVDTTPTTPCVTRLCLFIVVTLW